MAETNPTPEAAALAGDEKPRIVVLPAKGQSRGLARSFKATCIVIGSMAVVGLGLGMGYRAASLISPSTQVVDTSDPMLTERVNGGIYALELATPAGQSRWMLEFDADIITRQGPSNPLELRDALEKLVIMATSLPLVQTASNPDIAMRKAMLAMAAQDYPWLVDLHMRRSDIRTTDNRLQEMGAAIRNGTLQ